MIHLQIRAKSGLHAGAMWRLDQTFVSLGANPNADVFLCDPDIPENLITLRKMGRRYEIESVSQNVKLTSPDHKKVDDTLFPSQLLTLDFNHIQLELQVVNPDYLDSFHNTAMQFQKKYNAAPVEKTDLFVVMPAFVASELSEAFRIGLYLYLPFVIIDLAVSSALMALGMMMVSPMSLLAAEVFRAVMQLNSTPPPA